MNHHLDIKFHLSCYAEVLGKSINFIPNPVMEKQNYYLFLNRTPIMHYFHLSCDSSLDQLIYCGNKCLL